MFNPFVELFVIDKKDFFMSIQSPLKSILHSLEVEHPVIKTGRNQRLKLKVNFSDKVVEPKQDKLVVRIKSKEDDHVIIAYNSSTTEARQELIVLGKKFDHIDKLKAIYGYDYNSMVEVIHKKHVGYHHNFIQLYIQPGQLIVLENS